MFNPTCFTGDTEVYTDNGLVCIEEIEVGDSVWAYNPETGETELKEVLNVWVKETDEILHVSTSDGETIDTTTNHPFYVEEKGWVAAGDLEIGDVLYTADGDEVEVTDLELEKLAEPITVYNLEVEDFHTYFVGEYGVLVHNTYLYESKDPLVGEVANAIDDAKPGSVVSINKLVYRVDGSILTDLDIELDDIIIEVKSGGGNGLTKQLLTLRDFTNKIVVAYAPKVKPSVAREATKNGFNVFKNLDDLIAFILGNRT